jgi:magnesium transporter
MTTEHFLTAELIHDQPAVATGLLEYLDVDDAIPVLKKCTPQALEPVLGTLTPLKACGLLDNLDPKLAAAAIGHWPLPRLAQTLRGMNKMPRAGVFECLDAGLKKDLRILLDAPANSAAALMDPRVLHLQPSMAVQDAIDLLRAQQLHLKPTQTRRILLLVDEGGHIQGMVAIQDLALAQAHERLKDYMLPVPATVHPQATHEEIVKVLEDHKVSSLPVVDADNRLVGIVRQDELTAIVREDAAADIQAMFGVSREEEALSPPLFSVRQRQPWLQINLFTAFAAAAVVGLFEDTIAAYTALAVLLPVVAGQSGNTGAQALAVVMRGLALHEVTLAHWPQLLRKEVLVGLINGLGVALTTAVVIYLWSQSPELTAIIGLSMITSMLIAGMAGAAVPLVLARLGQDPAQASSIILTTITDVAGFFSFLGIASLLITSL